MKALALAVVLFGVAEQGWAQRVTESETGSHILIPRRARIPDQLSIDSTDRPRIVMAQFARCVVDREYRKVERALALPPGAEFERLVVAMSTSECLDGGQIRFKATAIRGPLFKEVYVRRAAAERAGTRWGPIVAKINLTSSASGLSDDEKQFLALMAFGKCVVAKDPDVAKRIVLAVTASAAQDAAIKEIVPRLGPCLPQGTTFRFGKQMIERTLAEVLYRDVEAPALTVTTGSESK